MKKPEQTKFMLRILWVLALYPLSTTLLLSQNAPKNNDDDALFIRKIYDNALTNTSAYPWLYDMCTKIGSRLSGSEGAAKAVQYTKQMLDTSGFTTQLQACMVPHWVRGEAEKVEMKTTKGNVALNALSIGNSIGTGKNGIEAEVIEVKSLDDVDKLGEKAKGKILFYNRPMDKTKIHTGEAYGGAGDQRRAGASRGAKYGALAVLVRSLTTELDDIPHTGALVYDENYSKIPAICISTNDAEKLSKTLNQEKNLKVFVKNTCQMLPDVESHNVIGEIKGSEFPNEIIVVGGHLDSWDPAQGAHDDGTGCMQSMGVLDILKKSGYKPKRTIRCVLFMNEENGLRGGTKYAEVAKANATEKHILAIESDGGGFTPRGFSFDADPSVFNEQFKKLSQWEDLLKPYDLDLTKGGSGADIGPLKPLKFMLAGLRPDSQRYFDLHHTAVDKIEYVNRRELELGAAAMAALVYLTDKYGL